MMSEQFNSDRGALEFTIEMEQRVRSRELEQKKNQRNRTRQLPNNMNTFDGRRNVIGFSFVCVDTSLLWHDP